MLGVRPSTVGAANARATNPAEAAATAAPRLLPAATKQMPRAKAAAATIVSARTPRTAATAEPSAARAARGPPHRGNCAISAARRAGSRATGSTKYQWRMSARSFADQPIASRRRRVAGVHGARS